MTKLFNFRSLTRILAIIALAATAYRLVQHGELLVSDQALDHFQRVKSFARLFTDVLLSLMAVFIAFRGSSQKGGQFFALFLVGLVLNDNWFYEGFGELLARFLLALNTALTSGLFVAAFQFFPEQLNKEQISHYMSFEPLRSYLISLTRGQRLWTVFVPVVLALTIVCQLLSFRLGGVLLNLMIILTVFGYMYISYKKVGIDSRSSILWLFWGVLCHVILVVFTAFMQWFNPGDDSLVAMGIAVLANLILLLMIFMSVFFAKSFDTGFIIKRTIVDGALFLLVILVYNVVEHYLLHTINHTLHINDVFLSSLFSGILVLVISPLHHKLTAYLNKKLRSGGHGH